MPKEQSVQVENSNKDNVQSKDGIFISKILNIMKDYFGWGLRILSIFGAITLVVANFIRYIQCMSSFSYYGLNLKFYQFNDVGILYDFIYSVIFMTILLVATFSLDKTIKCRKNFKSFIIWLVLFLIFHVFLCYNISSVYISKDFVANFVAILFCELFMRWTLKIEREFCEKQNEKDNSFDIRQFLKEFVLYGSLTLIVVIFCFKFSSYQSAKLQKEYRIIDGNKAIVYTTRDYYLTLDCKIEGENLILYKGAETKIDTDSVHSELHTYKKVFLK